MTQFTITIQQVIFLDIYFAIMKIIPLIIRIYYFQWIIKAHLFFVLILQIHQLL